MHFKTYLEVDLHAKNGKLLKRHWQESRSWTKHFFDLLYEPLGYAINSQAAINDISGTGRALTAGSNNYTDLPNLLVSSPSGGGAVIAPCNNAAGVCLANAPPYYTGDIIGVQIGTGNTAVAPTDDKLTTRIAHGESAGQMDYGGCELAGYTASGANVSCVIRRYFTNVAGGSIGVQETGIYAVGQATNGGTPTIYPFCICHDVVGTVTVTNGQILVVTYTLQTTV
jgi:hypothetical protein